MDVLFHFALAIIAGMAVGLHKKHGLRVIAALAFLALLVDGDHFISLFVSLPTRFLHNIFIFLLIPFALFLLANKLEKRGIKWQSYTLIFFAMMASHLVADYFGKGGVPFFYPFSAIEYQMPSWLGISFIKPYWYITTGAGFAMLFGGVIIMLTHFTEDFIYFCRGKHISKKKAWKKIVQEI